MSADVATKLRSFYKSARNRVRIKPYTNSMIILPATNSLEFISLDLLSPFNKTQIGFQYLLVIFEG